MFESQIMASSKTVNTLTWVVKTGKLIVDHRNALGDLLHECAVGVGIVGHL